MLERLPIKIDATSNGECRPVPLAPEFRAAGPFAADRIADTARRTGSSRRAFLTGLCGAATTLLAYQEVFAATARIGGALVLPKESAYEPVAAAETLTGKDFIFDVQTHMVDVNGAWRRRREGKGWGGGRSLASRKEAAANRIPSPASRLTASSRRSSSTVTRRLQC